MAKADEEGGHSGLGAENQAEVGFWAGLLGGGVLGHRGGGDSMTGRWRSGISYIIYSRTLISRVELDTREFFWGEMLLVRGRCGRRSIPPFLSE